MAPVATIQIKPEGRGSWHWLTSDCALVGPSKSLFAAMMDVDTAQRVADAIREEYPADIVRVRVDGRVAR